MNSLTEYPRSSKEVAIDATAQTNTKQEDHREGRAEKGCQEKASGRIGRRGATGDGGREGRGGGETATYIPPRTATHVRILDADIKPLD